MIKLEWQEPDSPEENDEYIDIDEHSREMSEAEYPNGVICAILSARNRASKRTLIEYFQREAKGYEIFN